MNDPGYHRLIPDDLVQNLKWRRSMYEEAAANPEFRRAMMQACSEDVNFFIKAFGWTYDPRLVGSGVQPKVPFIPYEFQVETFLNLEESVGKEDLLIEKSRDMGASWMLLAFFLWRFLFRDLQSFLLVSRKEDLVDKAGDPKSLFWKIDFILKFLPIWMRPKVDRKKLHLYNYENGSTIDGESTTGDVARGDRRTAIGLDEFAYVENGQQVLEATGDATNCRLFNSTPHGTGNAFWTQKELGTKAVRLHWTRHPVKARGLYDSHGGVLRIRDGSYEFAEDYKFILDGRERSPWYDGECRRRTPQEVAQELDIDYLGSAHQFFEPEVIGKLLARYGRPYIRRGMFEVDRDARNVHEWREDARGVFRTWVSGGDIRKFPECHPKAKYVIGCDIASGTGATPTVFSIVNEKTRVKEAEYANAYVMPEEAAHVAIALCTFYNGARLIWEANGPGRAFGQTVLDAGYANVYRRTNDESINKKVSDVPGWFSSKEGKRVLLGQYRQAMREEKIVIHTEESYAEASEYIYADNGSIVHSRDKVDGDPGSSGENHGDRVIADAVACKLITGPEAKAPEKETKIVLPGSFLWRRQQYQRDQDENRITW